MTRRFVALASVALLAAAALGSATPLPASATGVCPFAFGSAHTIDAFHYPVTASSSPTITVRQPLITTLFSFNVGSPTGHCTNVSVFSIPIITGTGLSATGRISGWCGHHFGEGATADNYRFAFVGVGAVLIFTGGLVGAMALLPDVTQGESCLTGADNFILSPLPAVVKEFCDTFTKRTMFGVVPVPFTLSTPVAPLSVHTGGWLYYVKLCAAVVL